MPMRKNILPIIAIVLILIWSTGLCKYAFFTEEKNCYLDSLTEKIKENNYKIDWIEKVLVDANAEKQALLQENQTIFKQIDEYLNTFVHNSSETWEPGQITEDGSQQVMPPVDETITESHERFKSIANSYWLDPSLIWETENHHGIKEWVILCIAIAETSGWKFWAGKNNIGNVGNTDSNPRGQSYSNVWASLDAIGRTLTNGYIGPKQTLWCLSNAGHCTEPNDNGKRYATSDGNRERNMVACLAQIYNTTIDPSTFSIRR